MAATPEPLTPSADVERTRFELNRIFGQAKIVKESGGDFGSYHRACIIGTFAEAVLLSLIGDGRLLGEYYKAKLGE